MVQNTRRHIEMAKRKVVVDENMPSHRIATEEGGGGWKHPLSHRNASGEGGGGWKHPLSCRNAREVARHVY